MKAFIVLELPDRTEVWGGYDNLRDVDTFVSEMLSAGTDPRHVHTLTSDHLQALLGVDRTGVMKGGVFTSGWCGSAYP